MKRAAATLFLLLIAISMRAGQVPVSFVTITGSNSNYAKGTITATFQPPANTSQASYSAQRFPLFQSATLSASGVFSLSVADNLTLLPAGSQWQLNMCSQGTYLVPPTCYLVTMPVTCIGNTNCSGSTLDLTSAFAGAPVPPGPSGSSNATSIQGVSVSTTPPTDQQCFIYSLSLSQWVPQSCPTDAVSIQGVNVSTTPPTDQQCLVYNFATLQYQPQPCPVSGTYLQLSGGVLFGPLTAPTYSNANGVLLPSALNGFHGSSGTQLQFSDGTGGTGHYASYGADGSLTDPAGTATVPDGSAGAAVTLTAGTNVTSVTCTTSICTTFRGSLQIVGGTATTGTIATIGFNDAPTSTIWCDVHQNFNGNATNYFIGHTAATSSNVAVTSGTSVGSATLKVDYICAE